LASDVTDDEEGDTAPDTIAILERPVHVFDRRSMSYPACSISEWNRRMNASPELRRRYGTQLKVDKILERYFSPGVQVTDEVLKRDFNAHNSAVTYTWQGLHRQVPNYWLAASSKQSIGEGDRLYFVFRRYKYRGGDAASPSVWRIPEDQHMPAYATVAPLGLSLVMTDLTANSAEVATNVNIAGPPGGAPVKFDNSPCCDLDEAGIKLYEKDLAMTGEEGDYYWNLDPFVSHDGCPPHPMLYSGDPQGDPNNQFVGDYWYVGQVTHCSRGPNNPSGLACTKAREALYPKKRGKSSHTALRTQDTLEINLGGGRV